MIRIGAVVLNTVDTDRAGLFWSQALAFDRGANPDFLVPREAGASRLHLDSTDRTHLDLWTDSAAEQRAEVERLISLGAARVDWDYPVGADFIVLADPTGNLFCVVDVSRQEP